METCVLSQLLFHHLSRIFGSAKEVRARRLYYGVKDCLMIGNGKRFVSSGSKAEGLDFPGSDLDLMQIDLRNVVYPDFRSCPEGKIPRLYISTDDTAPGFVHVNVRVKPCGGSFDNTPIFIFDGIAIDFVYTKYGIIVQNTSFQNIFDFINLNCKDLVKLSHKTHGPCQSNISGTVDIMFAFELHSWPNVASGWILRPRLSDWPSPDLISNIVHESLLLAPIGSKFGSLKDNPNEWRISFSMPEKLLVHNFNHTQLMCYVLLKILLKDILNKNIVTKNLLCSYFMKTTLFWTIEETGCSVWTPNNLARCFRACITKLSYWLKQKHLPNYFIPENNMIEGRFSEDSLSNLCTQLDLVNNEGVGFTSRTEILQDFLTTIHRKMTIKAEADETNVLFSLLTGMNISSLSKLPLKITLFLNTFKTKLIRYLFYCRFLYRMTDVPVLEKYDLNRSNKSLYCNYKSLLAQSLIGSNLRLSSWLMVAIVFYSHKSYKNTLRITDFIQSENSFMKKLSYDYEITMQGKLSIMQKIKLRSCKLIIGTKVAYVARAESLLVQARIFSNFSHPFRLCLSRSCLNYLRFMCYHHLKNVRQKRYALLDLFEEISPNMDPNDLDVAQRLMFVIKACFISNVSIPDNVLINGIQSFQSNVNTMFPNGIPTAYETLTEPCLNEIKHWILQQH